MAELPEVRTNVLPERVEPPKQLFNRDHTYGVAHDLERMRAGFAPAPRQPRIRTRASRHHAGLLAAVRGRWAASNNRPIDIWRRLRCRAGHHDFRGGHQAQLGSQFVYVERRCIWCDAAP